ncbi:MAG: hypothetical protein BACC_03783 [Bacteroides sp.]
MCFYSDEEVGKVITCIFKVIQFEYNIFITGENFILPAFIEVR